jgi:hypothetical protein
VTNFSNPPLWVLHKTGTKKRRKNAFNNPTMCELKGRNFSNPPLWLLHKTGTKKRSKNAFSNPNMCELNGEEFSNPLYDVFSIVGYGETVIQGGHYGVSYPRIDSTTACQEYFSKKSIPLRGGVAYHRQ